MKNLFSILMMGLITFPIFAQVGINTTSPTQMIDVNGNARIRGLANLNSRVLRVLALPDGTLVTQISDNSAPGIRFVGNLNTDLALTASSFFEIKLQNEIIDILNEHTPATGRYLPLVSSFYKVSMDFDIGDYTSITQDLDILIGLWDFTTNAWVLRRTFKHLSSNLTGYAGRNESYGISNYVQLTSGHSYGFRIFPTYNVAATKNAKLKYNNTGVTGPSLSTSFSIEKVI
jgi:hypothetical protein